MDNILASLQYYLAQNGRKKSTVQLYTFSFKRFTQECGDFSQEKIIKFLLNLKNKGCKNSYLNQYVDLLRTINKFHPGTGKD
jgi:hypothetical protein